MGEDLVVYPEVGAFPLWDSEGEVDYVKIPLSSQLKEALFAWNSEWEEKFFSDKEGPLQSGYEQWAARGDELAQRVQEELPGSNIRVDI